MSARARLLRNIGLGAATLATVVIAAGLLAVRTGWFREYIRQKIISSVEESTGGRVEVGAFSFDEGKLRATVRNLVIHGNEPANAQPFVSAGLIEVDLRLFTSLHRFYDITFLGVDEPRVNVMLLADGRTNIPTPKQKSTSNTSALESVVDLAVGKVAVNRGLLMFFSAQQPLTVQGRNLKVRLDYSTPRQAYDGDLAIEPLYVLNGRNTPVTFKVDLPVTLTKDRIDLHHATIVTPVSNIQADASIENMNNPKFTGHVYGHVGAEDLLNAGNIPVDPKARRNMPDLNLDANATAGANVIEVKSLRVGLGATTIEGSGPLKDANANGGFQLRANLALGELGRLANVAQRPEGLVSINATAQLDSSNRLTAGGNIGAKSLSFVQGKERISNIAFDSAFHADPQKIRVEGLRLSGFGGQLVANAELENMERYKVQGKLERIEIQSALRALGERLPYSGAISGTLDAQGDTKTAGTKSIIANAHLGIAPGRTGTPVSGRLNAVYNGAADDVVVENTLLALPHTRVTLAGTLGKRLNIDLQSHDLSDLLAAAGPAKGPPAVSLTNNGEADFSGAMTGSLSSPQIAGHVAVNRFAVEGRGFHGFGADVTASSSGAAVTNGTLTRDAMQARFDGRIGLRNWSPAPRSPIALNASLTNGDLADVMALAGQPATGYAGALSATAHVGGSYGNPLGAASVQVVNGTFDNEPFNQIQLEVNLADQLVTVPAAYVIASAGRIDLTAEFRHPRDSFSTGQIHAHVQSGNLNLAQLATLEKTQGKSSGSATINADVSGVLQKKEPTLLLTAVNGEISGHALTMRGYNYGDLNATARTTGQTVTYNATSDFAASNIKVNGNTQLTTDYPTTADLSIARLPVERVLAIAGRTDIPAKGLLSASAHVNGTIKAPEGNVQADLASAVAYGEKIDQAHLRATYLARSIDVPELQIVSGAARVDATAHYEHPEGDLQTGQARFTLVTNHVDLARLATVQNYRPGLGGMVDVNVNAAADVKAKDPRVLLTGLKGNVSATGIAAQGKQFGDLKLTASTQTGQRILFALDSNLAGSTIHGAGNATLAAQYPVDAQLSFRNVNWSRIAELTGQTGTGPAMFDASADGDVTVRGPVLNTAQLSGSLTMEKLSATTIPRTHEERPVTLANQGPIQIALDRGTIRIQSVHLTGPKTDIQAAGSAGINGENLNVTLNANADLGLIQSFDRDVYSQGAVVLAGTVRGNATKPLVNGQLTIQNAAFSMAGVPAGISNANGAIVFSGNTARISELTADSGGGKLTLGGFATYSDILRFGLRADAKTVRIRVQQGVSVTADAAIRLNGTTDNSRITGTTTVDHVSYAPQSDFGSMLTRSAPPIQSPETPSPLLSNMKLDIRVRNLPGMTVQSSLSENLQADIDLHVRGSVQEPGVQGRINISEGKLLFFGTTYTVNTGTIGFYNPVQIEPILDVSLAAQVQGVDVTLQVTGPVENMKLSYTSNPPLQFQEIISLLASGKTPTSDPTLLANQPAAPQQGLQQMGESALLGQAVANPVANQLQRVFGVTQLKIDPTFTTGSNVPTARLALQQRITNNLTFTYVSAIDEPNSSVVRVEWAFSPQWSAVATRDQNGIFSVNFYYKRQFH